MANYDPGPAFERLRKLKNVPTEYYAFSESMDAAMNKPVTYTLVFRHREVFEAFEGASIGYDTYEHRYDIRDEALRKYPDVGYTLSVEEYQKLLDGT